MLGLLISNAKKNITIIDSLQIGNPILCVGFGQNKSGQNHLEITEVIMKKAYTRAPKNYFHSRTVEHTIDKSESIYLILTVF